MSEISVVKRSGEVESLNLDKIHTMVEHACKGLAGVSESQVAVSYTHLTLPTTPYV